MRVHGLPAPNRQAASQFRLTAFGFVALLYEDDSGSIGAPRGEWGSEWKACRHEENRHPHLSEDDQNLHGCRDRGFEIVGFGTCNGQCSTGQDGIGARGALFKRMEANIIHLSSCIKLKCPNHTHFFEALSADFTVVDHTHALK